MNAGVLVVADASRGALTSGAREALALARSLADALRGGVDLLAFGAPPAALAGDAGAAGADRVCDAAGAQRSGYHPEAFAAIALAAARELRPRVIVLCHGAMGVDLAPRIAFGLGARWATQCTGASVESGALRCRRNEVGGKVHVVEDVEGQVVITLRPKSVDIPPPHPERSVALVPVAAPAAPGREGVVFLERKLEDGGAALELEQAQTIVTGGLGLGSPEAFDKLRELANALGASLGASKQAVDRGWIAPSRQIGLTGTTVAPKVYIAIGVSGALQHMAGCHKAKTIVAINTDASAPIFKFAKYGVVAKWEELVPALIAKLPARPAR